MSEQDETMAGEQWEPEFTGAEQHYVDDPEGMGTAGMPEDDEQAEDARDGLAITLALVAEKVAKGCEVALAADNTQGVYDLARAAQELTKALVDLYPVEQADEQAEASAPATTVATDAR